MKCRALNKNEPTAAQRRALKHEVKKEFLKLLDHYNRETCIQILHILHFDFGYGQQRLEKFADKLAEMQTQQLERYELDEDDTTWLCEKQLKSDGIDVEKILKGGVNNEQNIEA